MELLRRRRRRRGSAKLVQMTELSTGTLTICEYQAEIRSLSNLLYCQYMPCEGGMGKGQQGACLRANWLFSRNDIDCGEKTLKRRKAAESAWTKELHVGGPGRMFVVCEFSWCVTLQESPRSNGRKHFLPPPLKHVPSHTTELGFWPTCPRLFAHILSPVNISAQQSPLNLRHSVSHDVRSECLQPRMHQRAWNLPRTVDPPALLPHYSSAPSFLHCLPHSIVAVQASDALSISHSCTFVIYSDNSSPLFPRNIIIPA